MAFAEYGQWYGIAGMVLSNFSDHQQQYSEFRFNAYSIYSFYCLRNLPTNRLSFLLLINERKVH